MTNMQFKSDVEQVMNAIANCDGDHEIVVVLKEARNSLPYDVWKEVLEEFSFIADFYIDSNERFLSRMAGMSKARSRINQFKQSLLSKQKNSDGDLDLEGLQVSNLDGNKFAFFCKDATCAGQVRFSMFDANGFICHVSRPAYRELIDEAVSYGFVQEVKGKLEDLSSKPEFFNMLVS